MVVSNGRRRIPAGKIFTRVELEGLAEIAREFELFVLADEIYERTLCMAMRSM